MARAPFEQVRVRGLPDGRMTRDEDGTLWINSFAHGGKTYELKFDFAAAGQPRRLDIGPIESRPQIYQRATRLRTG